MRFVKKFTGIFLAALTSISVLACIPAYAQELSLSPTGLVTDNAGVIDDIDAVEKALEEAKENSGNKCDILVYTTNEYLTSPMNFSDDRLDEYLDAEGKEDGIMLVISMSSRDWYITTTGYGIYSITDYCIDVIGDRVSHILSDGDYDKAFTTFAGLCEDFINEASEGTPYDVGHRYRTISYYLIRIAIGFGIGLVAASIVLAIFIKQLKSAQRKVEANEFIKQDSLNFTKKSDLFLYNTVTKTVRSSSSSSSGGSSTHRSSGGRSHGGGGGKF